MKTEEAVKEGFLKQCIASILILCIAFMTVFAIPQSTQSETTVKKNRSEGSICKLQQHQDKLETDKW